MPLRLHLALIVLLPLVGIVALLGSGQKLTIPEFGRDYVLRFLLPNSDDERDLPVIFGPSDDALPLIVLDPGHGGRDPGAVGQDVLEKDITLALAKALKDRLVRQGGFRIALTRVGDTALALEERSRIARDLQADLFVSLHADSAGEKSDISGASIYTLSNTASSDAAARYAKRENDADRLNGISIEGQSEEVSAILVELSQRHAQEQSSQFADLVLREGEGRYVFVPDAKRSADFVVLRTPDMPSILFEGGFVTNSADADRLISDEGKAAFADMMARAIRIYFARQSSAPQNQS